MNYREYQDFVYFVTKEDHYYHHIFRRSKEEEEKAKYYRHLRNILEAFEIDAIKEALRKTHQTKQGFLDECTKDFE